MAERFHCPIGLRMSVLQLYELVEGAGLGASMDTSKDLGRIDDAAGEESIFFCDTQTIRPPCGYYGIERR